MSIQTPEPKLEATPDHTPLGNPIDLTMGLRAVGQNTGVTIRYSLAPDHKICFLAGDGTLSKTTISRTTSVSTNGTPVRDTIHLAANASGRSVTIFTVTATVIPTDGSSRVRSSDKIIFQGNVP